MVESSPCSQCEELNLQLPARNILPLQTGSGRHPLYSAARCRASALQGAADALCHSDSLCNPQHQARPHDMNQALAWQAVMPINMWTTAWGQWRRSLHGWQELFRLCSKAEGPTLCPLPCCVSALAMNLVNKEASLFCAWKDECKHGFCMPTTGAQPPAKLPFAVQHAAQWQCRPPPQQGLLPQLTSSRTFAACQCTCAMDSESSTLSPHSPCIGGYASFQGEEAAPFHQWAGLHRQTSFPPAAQGTPSSHVMPSVSWRPGRLL